MRRIVFIAYVVNLLLSGCTKEPRLPLQHSVKEQFQYLFNDPQIIIYFNAKEIRKTPYWEKIIKSQISGQKNSQLDEFINQTGLSFENGIDEMILANEWNDKTVMILNGDFNAQKVKEYFSTKHFLKKNFNFHFPNERTIVVSNDSMWIFNIASGKKYSPFLDNKDYIDIIDAVKFKNQFWIATNQNSVASELIAKGAKVLNPRPFTENEKVKELTNSIRYINLSAKFGTDVNVNSYWQCTDELKAALLKSVMNGLISFITLTSPNDPLINEIANADVSLNYKSVEINLTIPENKLKEIRNSSIKDKIKLSIEK